MSRYRSIQTKLWHDKKIRSLDPETKLVFLYLLTSPYTHVSGIYNSPPAIASYEIGIEPGSVLSSYQKLVDLGLIQFDDSTNTIWIKNYLTYQVSNPSILKSVAAHVGDLEDSATKSDFINYYRNLNIPYQQGVDRVSTGCRQGGVDKVLITQKGEDKQVSGHSVDRVSTGCQQGVDTLTVTVTDPVSVTDPISSEKIDEMESNYSAENSEEGPAILPADRKPISDEHAQLLEITSLHAETHGFQIQTRSPGEPLRWLILQGLREFGLEKCEAAVRGHQAMCKQEPKRGKGLRFAFPQSYLDPRKLDPDKFQEFIQEGDKIPGAGRSGNGSGFFYLGRGYTREEAEKIGASVEVNDISAGTVKRGNYLLIKRCMKEHPDWKWKEKLKSEMLEHYERKD